MGGVEIFQLVFLVFVFVVGFFGFMKVATKNDNDK
jgi:hypothetical protein